MITITDQWLKRRDGCDRVVVIFLNFFRDHENLIYVFGVSWR